MSANENVIHLGDTKAWRRVNQIKNAAWKKCGRNSGNMIRLLAQRVYDLEQALALARNDGIDLRWCEDLRLEAETELTREKRAEQRLDERVAAARGGI